jgi:hypothetical protein
VENLKKLNECVSVSRTGEKTPLSLLTLGSLCMGANSVNLRAK